jgi:hypothetical protein
MNELKAILDANSTRTILAMVALAVPFTIYFLNRKRKALCFDVVRNDKLFQLDEELKSRVQVTVDGRLVDNVSLVIIDIMNTGNEPIKKDDFDKPLSFFFGDNAEVISARVLGAKPDDICAQLSVMPASVSLDPLLLNKSDSMSIEIILTKSTKMISHTARIVGIPDVKNVTGSSAHPLGDAQLFIVIAITLVYIAASLCLSLGSTSIFPHWKLASPLVLGVLDFFECYLVISVLAFASIYLYCRRVPHSSRTLR